jgi:hypothetical protein
LREVIVDAGVAETDAFLVERASARLPQRKPPEKGL